MIGVKAVFVQFDRTIFQKNWKAINETPLKKTGVTIRKVAVRSIRRAKTAKPSPPGSPPRTRGPGDPLRRIFSVVDHLGTRVSIGPVGFGKSKPVPMIHEFGETIHLKPYQRKALQLKINALHAKGRNIKGQFVKKGAKAVQLEAIPQSVTYPKRPTMKLALEKTAPKIPSMYAGSIKGGQ